MQQQQLDPEAVAKLLALHPETVRKLARLGKLPGYRVGRSWRFDPDTLRQWQQEQRRDATGA